jgi:hypothetical protein
MIGAPSHHRLTDHLRKGDEPWLQSDALARIARSPFLSRTAYSMSIAPKTQAKPVTLSWLKDLDARLGREAGARGLCEMERDLLNE